MLESMSKQTEGGAQGAQSVSEKLIKLKPGMSVRVYQKVKEIGIKGEEKERVQYFEGMVIARKHGNEKGGTITLFKNAGGVGVEKIFPINLPTITRVELKKQVKVRRSKLNYLKSGYKKRLKELR